MVVAVWVLDTALDAILEVVAVVSTGIGGCDIPVATGSSGRDWRGWEACWVWGAGRGGLGGGSIVNMLFFLQPLVFIINGQRNGTFQGDLG